MGAQSSSISSWWRQYNRTIATIGVSHLLYATFNWLYDQMLYVFVVYRLGLLYGGSLMTAGSLLQCAALLLRYQRVKVDWVGASAVHSFESREHQSWTAQALSWAIRTGRVPIFVCLCVTQDPFITTAYFKKGQFEPLTARDWQVFVACVLVSNGYWTLRSGALGQILAWSWRHFIGDAE